MDTRKSVILIEEIVSITHTRNFMEIHTIDGKYWMNSNTILITNQSFIGDFFQQEEIVEDKTNHYYPQQFGGTTQDKTGLYYPDFIDSNLE